jgi:DNA-binding CsgD family transcriptional regulator
MDKCETYFCANPYQHADIVLISEAIAMKAFLAAGLPMGLEADILKSIRVPLAVIDPEFHFLWLNREMARIYQTRPKLARGRICYQLASGQVQPCPDCPVQAAQKSGHREVSQKYKDFPGGVRKFGELYAFPVFNPENKIMATVLMVVEITDKIVVNMDDTYRRLAQWMPMLQRVAQLPSNAWPKAQTERRIRQTRPLKNCLTHRETHVLRLLAKGQANNEIAAHLQISPHTVKSHVINIFNKLGVNDRIQAAVWATKHGLID